MLLGVLAGVAAPRYQSAITSIELEAAAKRLAADLRAARSLALTTSTSRGINFAVMGNAYQTLDDATHTPIPDPDRPDQDLLVWFGGGTSRVALTSADFAGATQVSFDFRGDADAAGQVTLASGGAVVTITVNEAGLVEVSP